jgi:hypothetical protein
MVPVGAVRWPGPGLAGGCGMIARVARVPVGRRATLMRDPGRVPAPDATVAERPASDLPVLYDMV